MKKPNIYKYLSYQDYLRDLVEMPDKERGYRAEIALSIGIQKSYLSRSISKTVHLTRDHVFKLSKFLKLNRDEAEYLMYLLDYAKAGDHEYQEFLKTHILKKQKENSDLDKRIEKKQMAQNIEDDFLYYSNWVYPAIHMLLTIEKYQSAESIAERLEIPQGQIKIHLSQLETMGLAKREGENWQTTNKNIHLAKNSPYRRISHQNWRIKALEKMAILNEENIHYNSLYTLSHRDIENLKEIVEDFIENTRQVVIASEEQELVCLNLDFFKI